jgi:hypothetical protein
LALFNISEQLLLYFKAIAFEFESPSVPARKFWAIG